MYDVTLTHQSLPSEKYIRMLGIAVSVFSSNNAFIIENILRTSADTYSWHSLIDKESGQLRTNISETISRKAGKNIEQKFVTIVDKRNRIMHGFRITSNYGEQILGTKDKKTQEQFEITEEYLLHFIHENDELSKMLHDYRGH